MKILDSHIHIFNARVIKNVIDRTELVNRLSLQEEGIYNRLDTGALLEDMESADVKAALMLPTSDVKNLTKVNRFCIDLADDIPELFTAGTLHPEYQNIEDELSFLNLAGIRVIKLCSFSQGFALKNTGTRKMFQKIQNFNKGSNKPFSLVLDTLTLADRYFGTDPKNTTTPGGFYDLAASFPGINFIGAHMGGLGASFDELDQDLKPLPNLFLDTSNASHTLTTDQFIQMLCTHGPEHILFGTDWPWFIHSEEVMRINGLMEKTGFNEQDKEAVFSTNLEIILGLNKTV